MLSTLYEIPQTICYRLSISSLRVLETRAPSLVIKLLTNLLRTSTAITARLTAEVSSLAS